MALARLAAHIIAAGIREAASDYRAGVAAQIEGLPGDVHWNRVEKILARAYVLAGLVGLEAAARQARRHGAELDMGPEEPITTPEGFRREDDAAGALEAAFEPGPFFEAIEGFEGRVPMLAREVRELAEQAQNFSAAVMNGERRHAASVALGRSGIAQMATSGTFFVTGADKTTIINLKALLGEVIRGDVTADAAGRILGVSLGEFASRAKLAGAVNLTNNRLQTIFRNNLSSAYNDAQARILSSGAVRKALPLMMLEEIRDRRTRGNPTGLYPDGFHWQMNGYVGTAEDFRSLGLTPPNGHNCRASVRGVTFGEAKRRGWIDDDGDLDLQAIRDYNGERAAIIGRGDYPDPGFLAGVLV